ncbi:MAG: chromosome segregation protein SMC [Planctomycetes bacterium]|nr:chromosome segregation protein SMC [Planctomycetota bacterium]
MQLKKLEMCGFKSFAQKTAIHFEPGVTVVVGPNGSGKSNVVDAIKWVLGTLSYKSVRGDEMMDVVFKGGGGLGPAGFAEVSLTLDNSDHALPLEFEEVTIARRLHRDGVGEYTLNGSPCRLKDIRDLLYGTGIGTDNYSIIEQGKIDRLVTTDPRGRRLVFDEAAGISKYRAKRKETELRLEKVTGDLERLQMLINEVRSQLRSVRGQASRAAKYKEMKDEYAARRTKLVAHEYRLMSAQARELEERIAAIETEQRRRAADLEAARAELAKLSESLAGLDAKAGEIQRVLSAASSRADYLASTIQQGEARLADLAQERARADQERAEAAARVTEGEGLHARIEADRAETERALDALCARLAETQERLHDAARECKRVREDLDAKKAEGIELAHKESMYRTDLNKAKADSEALVRRRERTSECVATSERELMETRGKLEELSERRRVLEGEIEDLKTRISVEEDEQRRRAEERTRLEEELLQLRAGRDRSESRAETLRDLQLSYEGLGSGARELLRNGLAGVRGTVVDLLDASDEHVPMIEAALGEAAGAVVVDTMEQARAALDYVRQHNLDRTTVLALEACGLRERRQAPLLAGVISRASDVVRSAPDVAPLVQTLLGEVLFVEGAEDAGALRELWSVRGTMVTRSGEVYDGRGLVTVGARKAGLLARKVDLRKLESEIGEFTRLIEDREARRRALDAAVAEGQERQKALRQEIYEKGVALTEARTHVEQLDKRAAFLGGEVENACRELEQMEVEAAALAERQGRLDGLLAELAGLKEELSAEAATLNELIARYEEGRAQIQSELTSLSMERAQAEEKYRGLQQQVEGVRRDLERQREIVRRNEEHVAEIDARGASVRAEIESHRAQQAQLVREVEGHRQALAVIDEDRAGVRDQAQAQEGRMREGEQAAAVAAQQVSELKIQQAREQVERENLVQRAQEEFQMDLGTLPAEEEPLDWEALGREAQELQVKIANFGTVNVVALEQLKELEARDGELVGQHEDITRTKRELEELIRRLNTECRIKFEKTLEFVREEFNGIFRKVFGGGKADIVLEQAEGVDPMDQGLEIMARPPQKDQLPISLLSGGEKSLTAFSMVMALFRANPSPFCILDEADAALDEKNVDRFAGIINEFVGETQFIVISHNKRTMSTGDVLYGVTMQTPGVSTIVNVDLHGGEGLELLRGRRDEIRRARAESSVKKQAAMSELQAAAATALAEEGAEGGP